MLRVRRRSVYEAIYRGDIPGVPRIGRKVRIDRDSALAWMADGQRLRVFENSTELLLLSLAHPRAFQTASRATLSRWSLTTLMNPSRGRTIAG